MRNDIRLVFLLVTMVAALGLSGCGGPYHRWAVGDVNGVPVQLVVTLSRDYVRDLRNRGPVGRETVIYSNGFYSGWHGGYGHASYCPPGYRYRYDPFWHSNVYWTGPAPTVVYLLGGDGPSQARLLRTELDYGTNIIDVCIRPGRVVTLTVQAYGGLEGWEVIAAFTAADTPGQRVVIDITEHPPQVTITNPDGTVFVMPTTKGPPVPTPVKDTDEKDGAGTEPQTDVKSAAELPASTSAPKATLQSENGQ